MAGPRPIPYAGDLIRVLAQTPEVAFVHWPIPARFAGPPPHHHDDFDEALYVLEGALTMTVGRAEPEPAPTGTLIFAPRGVRHCFANPHDQPALVLGTLTPGTALAFIAEIGAALPPTGPVDPELLRPIYERHHSALDP